MSRIANFIVRNNLAARKVLWRVFNNYSPNARAVYIFGAQRSGTTLLLECLERSMDFEVLGEVSRAMVNYRIRSDDFIKKTVTSSFHRFVVFKPLTDSHRARQFLMLSPNSAAVWAFRRVEDRVNSSVAKFGDHNLRVLRDLSKGQGLERWQAQGLTEADLSFIRRFDYSTMSPHTASALFWYLRNSLYFTQCLENLSNVIPLAYEDLVSDPRETMMRICKFLRADFRDELIRNVHAKSIGRTESHLSDDIIALCRPLYDRLHAIQKTRWRELDG